MDRRSLIKMSAYLGSTLATYSLYRFFRGPASLDATPEPIYRARQQVLDKSIYDFSNATEILPEEITSFRAITNYNNFYEFTTDKESVAQAAAHWKIQDWKLEIDGLVEKPLQLSLQDIRKIETEDRLYRFRCVEGWAMVIPWQGFPLASLLEKARPTSKAKYVAFESYFDEKEMPSANQAGLPFPYVEGLRLDEALNPLTLLATGLYGKNLPNQNGAPIRLVVPWKYGFKSIKSITKIRLVEEEPKTTWNQAGPNEYGFYSNVNPEVDHPRWSQKTERRIGEISLKETLIFNGYEKQVAHMYRDMDLRKYF